MNTQYRTKLIAAFFALCAIQAYAQKGPGGVSVETGTTVNCGPGAISTNGMWLDASQLNLADGALVGSWTDVSYSNDCDHAVAVNTSLKPIFRDSPSSTINGLPTITFDNGQYFKLTSSNDLNTDAVTYNKTVTFAFRTSNDVTTKQFLYEEGGTVRGFNVVIDNDEVIIGAYDYQRDGGDATDPWGYTYVRTDISPNTTYILTAQFYAPRRGNQTPYLPVNNGNDGVDTNPNYIRGWLNGKVFGDGVVNTPNGMILGPDHGRYNQNNGNAGLTNLGIGTLYNHPNPCGVGAINDDSVDRDGVMNGAGGDHHFIGRLAEVCYYKDNLNETQRIIVENYLVSKYLANFASGVIDRYDHDEFYGEDVIGLGKLPASASTLHHSISQGRNPFIISADLASQTNGNLFFLTGHNGNSLALTTTGVPNNTTHIQRIKRIYRLSKTAAMTDVTWEIDQSLFPSAPTGFGKLVMLIDETNSIVPNFTLPSTVVKEIPLVSGDYKITYDIPDGAFYTFAWLRTEVNFSVTEALTLEGDNPPDHYKLVNVEVSLNYAPEFSSGVHEVHYTLSAGTAVLGAGPLSGHDFYYDIAPPYKVTILPGEQTANIPIRIINDLVQEPSSTETFTVGLNLPVSSGLVIGANNILNFTIYDNDPPPKIGFGTPFSSTVDEGDGTVSIPIVRAGTTNTAASCTVSIHAGGTTASASGGALDPLDPDDYDFTNNVTVNFPANNPNPQYVTIDILNDMIDEVDENIRFIITSIAGAAIESPAAAYHDLTIIDDDIPVATFPSEEQSGFESIGDPVLLVKLEPISSRPVLVGFTMADGSGPYPAINPADYTGTTSGTVLFPAFAEEAVLGPFFVDLDNITEPDPETIDFELTQANSSTYIDVPSQTPATNVNLEYSILDYSAFEWKGIGGVGTALDNIIWIDASKETPGDQSSLANQTSYSIGINQKNNPASNIVGINGRYALDFNGYPSPARDNGTGAADVYQIANNSKINTSGSVNELSYFFVFRPDAVPSVDVMINNQNPDNRHARLIYEQGGGARGTSIYLYNGYLYFHAWNNADNDGPYNATPPITGNQAPWGSGAPGISVYARSQDPILPNTNYIVSCHYDNNNETEPLKVFVNGEQGTMSPGINAGPDNYGVGRLYGHSGAVGLGAVVSGTRMHFTNRTAGERKCAFDGKIAEFFSFHEPQMNEARRIIIENYLSAKYAIPFKTPITDTPQVFDLGFAGLSDGFNRQVAGIGQVSVTDGHGDAQGPNALLRVNNASFGSGSNFMVWGHNGDTLTNTWPYSYWNAELPTGIQERSGLVWKFFKSGTVGNFTVLVDISSSNNRNAFSPIFGGDPSLLKLLINTTSDSQDFSSAAVYPATTVLGGYIAKFDNIPITQGMYTALGNTSPVNMTPLPIELLSFDAKLNGGHVDLNWITSTEINNDYFVVERADGNLAWKEILTQNGAGNSNTQLHYSDLDRNPLNGISYYRLKQVDFDGAYSYSDIVSVSNSIVRNDHVLLFPNPSGIGTVFVSLPSEIQDETTISMTDMTGKIVIQEKGIFNQNLVELNYGSLPQGIYLINVRSSSFSETKKLVVH